MYHRAMRPDQYMSRLSERQLQWILAALCLGAGATAMALKGTMPVSSAPWGVPHRPSFFYMVMAFPFYGVLIGSAAFTWLRGSGRLAVQLFALGVLAAARLATGVPISGHVVLQVFFVLWAYERHDRWWLAVGLLGLGYLGYTKLYAWRDVVTPATATLAGVLIWFLPHRAQRKPSV